VKTAHIDESCAAWTPLACRAWQTQAATDGERGVHLTYCAFYLLHLNGWDLSSLPLTRRKELLEPMVTDKAGVQFNGHDTGDGELIVKHARQGRL
jgi:ATP-dependent DNA ligase